MKSNNTFKKIRKKRCKVCNELFTPYLTTQVVCGTNCAVKYAKDKVSKDKINLDKLIKEDKDRKSLSASLNLTKNIVHRFVRNRDNGKPCISCGAQYKNDFDAGHFYPAGKFTALKFDLDNIHGQCQKCNRYNEGEFEKYSLRLPNRIGVERYNNLVKRANTSLRYVKKWTRTELKEIQKNIKNEK